MKKIVVSFLTLVMFSIVSCGSSDSPSIVVKKYNTRVAEGKMHEAFDLYTQEGKALMELITKGRNLLEPTERVQRKGGLKSIEILSEKIIEDNAEVRYKLSYGNGATKNIIDKLIKEQGEWHLIIRSN